MFGWKLGGHQVEHNPFKEWKKINQNLWSPTTSNIYMDLKILGGHQVEHNPFKEWKRN